MPTPAVTLKLKKFRRRFGIAAPRVVVRSHLPWAWFALPAVTLLLVLVAAAWSMFSRDEVGAVGRELEALRQQLQVQREELDLLRSTAGTRQNAVSMERAAQQKLLARIKGLSQENGVLKEELLLFERLIPVVGEAAVVRIENFRVIHEDGLRYRYRLLLAFQPDKQNPEFRGRLQLAAGYSLVGKELQLLLPDKRDGGAEYLLELKHFLRREGVFELPPGAEIRAVEARVLQGDTLKSKRLAQL